MILYRVKQAAELLNLSQSRLYEMCQQNEIGHFRLKSSIRISDEHIKEYLASCEHGRGDKASTWPERLRLKTPRRSTRGDWF